MSKMICYSKKGESFLPNTTISDHPPEIQPIAKGDLLQVVMRVF